MGKNREEIFDGLTRKWSLIIIKDIFFGCRYFNDFLKFNPKISSKVLSDELKKLEKKQYIHKKIMSIHPMKSEYKLAKKGLGLNKVLYEMMVFAKKNDLVEKNCELLQEKSLEKVFGIN